MANFNRRMWTSILFAVLLAPLCFLLILSVHGPLFPVGAAASSQPAGDGNGAGSPLLPPPTTGPATTAEASEPPLFFAAGDAKALWLVRPVYSNNAAAYQLLKRESNSGVWSTAEMDGNALARGFPQGLAASALEGSGRTPDAYVFARGSLTRFGLHGHDPKPCLPKDHVLVSVSGTADELVALTVGIPPEGAQHAGDQLPPGGESQVLASAGTQPDTTSPFDVDFGVAASRPATSAPATAPVLPKLMNAYLFKNGRWMVLPALGEASSEPSAGTPSLHAFVATAAVGDRFIALWVEPDAPSTLVARAIDTSKPNAAWSEPVTSRLEEALPSTTRLMTAVLDGAVYVVWPVISAEQMYLRGGWIISDGGKGDLTLPTRHFLPAIALGSPATDEGPGNIAVAPAENSLAVVSMTKDRKLACQIFDQRGRPVTQLAAIQPQQGQQQVQIVQNIAMVVMILVLFLSLWQWRQQSMRLSLPEELSLAPLHLRAFGFAIDFGLPLIIVGGVMGAFDAGTFSGMFSTWFAALWSPEELTNSPLLLYVLGAYLVHVTLGELFFRRSVGKAILGLQVLMIDGRAPTLAAVLLRNLVRIPELLCGVLIVYIFISDQRQRLGDLFARTVVVAQRKPPTPPDPDEEEKAVAAGKREEGSR